MADRYWVGGTGSWDGTAGTKWATTSGGAGGASVPTSADDVYFDNNSGTGTVTIVGSRSCKKLDCGGYGSMPAFTGTLAGSSTPVLTVVEYIFLNTSMTVASSFPDLIINPTGYCQLDFRRKTINNLTINGVAGQRVVIGDLWNLTNLTINAPSSAGEYCVWFYYLRDTIDDPAIATTVSGVFTVAGSNGNKRIAIQGETDNASLTKTTYINAASVSLTDVDFVTISGSGAASPFTGTRLGKLTSDVSNITTDTPKTVYWSLLAGGDFTSNAWATTSGGTPATTNFPLPQDTLVIDNAGLTTGNTITLPTIASIGSGLNNNEYKSYAVPSINFTRTNAFVLEIPSGDMFYYGTTFSLPSSTSTSGTGRIVFEKRSSDINIGFNGASSLFGVFIKTWTNTTNITSNISCGLFSCGARTFNTNNYDIICTSFGVTTSNNNPSANLGSSTITVTGGGASFSFSNPFPTFTFNAGTSTIILADTSTSTKTFAGGGFTFNNVVFGAGGGDCTYTITGSNTFNSLTSNKTSAFTVSLTAGTTQTVKTFGLNGSSGNVMTLQGSTSSRATLVQSTGNSITINHATIKNISASPTQTWYANNSTDAGNNVNITFLPRSTFLAFF